MKNTNKYIKTKKLLKSGGFFVFIFIIISLKQITFASFSDPLWLDMYNDIYKWYNNLSVKYITRELKWTTWEPSTITDQLNTNTRSDCFKSDITQNDLAQISAWIIRTDLIKDECKNEKSMQFIDIANLMLSAKSYYDTSVTKAENKLNSTYSIARVWLFTDWIKENSPFDLSLDIQDINSIIFEEEIPYNWVNKWSLFERENRNFINNLNGQNSVLYNSIPNELTVNNLSNTQNLWVKLEKTNISNWNNYVCNINDSWLNSDSITDLFAKNNWNIPPNEVNNNSTKPKNPILNNNLNIPWSYQRVTDNSIWPCNNFFCITVEFVVTQHNLLWWWKNLSIEWLLKRSSEHLKKFAWTSLIQAKLPVNTFEIWLSPMNLPDMFHIWVQITKKPPPILNLVSKPEEKEKNSEYSSKNLLKRYYKNIWLEYDRINDLSIIDQTVNKYKSVLDSQLWVLSDVASREDQLIKINERSLEMNKSFSELIIDKKIVTEEWEQFYNEFLELWIFVASIKDYAVQVDWIVDWMLKIPIWWKN